MEQFEHLEETQLSSEAKYDGTLLHIRRDTVRLPDGKTATREYNIHNGAVCIIPLLENGEVLLERQYRYPLREVITEIPAGKLDAPDEDPLEAAQRELREETGATAAEWHALGLFCPVGAYSTERIQMYLARGLTFGERERRERKQRDRACQCDDAGDCVLDGNFCGVCPVIGRLRITVQRISLR